MHVRHSTFLASVLASFQSSVHNISTMLERVVFYEHVRRTLSGLPTPLTNYGLVCVTLQRYKPRFPLLLKQILRVEVWTRISALRRKISVLLYGVLLYEI